MQRLDFDFQSTLIPAHWVVSVRSFVKCSCTPVSIIKWYRRVFTEEWYMSKFQSNRNFGWGKKIEWAGKLALADHYGQGHFGTIATHSSQWNVFATWLNETYGIRNACDITQPILEAYAEMLKILVAEDIKDVAYCQNLLSGVNITLSAMSGNSILRIASPSDYVGHRIFARTDQPTGYQWDHVHEVATHLHCQGLLRARFVVLLCRHFGVRLREAILADIYQWNKQADRNNAIDVREGTKGGRGNEVERWISVTDQSVQLLHEASSFVKSLGSVNHNLLLAEETYDNFVNYGEIYRARLHLHKFQIKGYHDLRSSWACERYRQLTGFLAPILEQGIEIDKDVDRSARLILTKELGHDRVEIVSQYIGSRK